MCIHGLDLDDIYLHIYIIIYHRCIIDASDSRSFCSQMPSGYGDVTVQNGSKIFMSLYVLTGTVLVANILNGWLERLIL